MRTALRGASTANLRLRDPAMTAQSESTMASDYARLEEWCIEMLVAQVNGDDPAIARAAISVLEEATEDERCLRTLVSVATTCDATLLVIPAVRVTWSTCGVLYCWDFAVYSMRRGRCPQTCRTVVDECRYCPSRT